MNLPFESGRHSEHSLRISIISNYPAHIRLFELVAPKYGEIHQFHAEFCFFLYLVIKRFLNRRFCFRRFIPSIENSFFFLRSCVIFMGFLSWSAWTDMIHYFCRWYLYIKRKIQLKYTPSWLCRLNTPNLSLTYMIHTLYFCTVNQLLPLKIITINS